MVESLKGKKCGSVQKRSRPGKKERAAKKGDGKSGSSTVDFTRRGQAGQGARLS